jgi:hypothetical protein
MSRLQCRGSIFTAGVLVAILFSRPACAQIGVDPGPPRENPCLCRRVIIGAETEIVAQKIAVRHLQKVQAKLKDDAERGDTAAVDHDLHRIDKLNYCIATNEWLIRWNMRQYPDFYPPARIDPLSVAVIAEFTHGPLAPYRPQSAVTLGRMAAAPTMPVTIANVEKTGASISFAIEGVAHELLSGARLSGNVAVNSNITYDAGGTLGKRRYRLSPGLFEFRSTAEGWALYKVSDQP